MIQERRFGSWPENGAPEGYFTAPLGDDAAEFYRENGFLVLLDAFSADEVRALNDETLRICRGELGEVRGVTPADPSEPDDEVLRRYLCIHFPYKLSEPMMRQAKSSAIADVLTRIIGPDVKCMQSMLFVKASGKPGQAWHQDEDYIPTRDRSLTGAWMALDDATTENGCLWVIPGSHKPGVLWPMSFHGDERFDCAQESYGFPYTTADEVPVEVPAGAVVFFNGYTLHRSLPNVAKAGYRRSLVNHYMSASSLLPWHHTGKTGMALEDHRDVFMVAGKDPYAYKGTEDFAEPHVRPSGEGGCGDPRKNRADA